MLVPAWELELVAVQTLVAELAQAPVLLLEAAALLVAALLVTVLLLLPVPALEPALAALLAALL